MTRVVPINKAQKNISHLIDETSQNHEPILITGKKNNAVIISEEDYRAIEETLYLLSIPKMRESIIEGLNTPIQECLDELEW